MMTAEQTESPQVLRVLKATCSVFGVSEKQLLGGYRLPSLVYCRRVAWAAIKELYPYVSTTEIGVAFKRDHTTVVDGLQWCRDNDKLIAKDVATVKVAVQKAMKS